MFSFPDTIQIITTLYRPNQMPTIFHFETSNNIKQFLTIYDVKTICKIKDSIMNT